MHRRRRGRFGAVVAAGMLVVGCSDDDPPTGSSAVDAIECFDGEAQVSKDEFMLVLGPDEFYDSAFAVRVSGRLAEQELLDEVSGPLARPLDVRRLVGRRVDYSSTALRSGGMLFVFESDEDRTDTICAVSDLPESSNVKFERATLTG